MIYVEVRIDSDTQYLARIESEKDIEALNVFIHMEMEMRKHVQGVEQIDE